MTAVVNSSDDAARTALGAARACGCYITGQVRAVGEIRPGHRLALEFVNEPFWMVRLETNPPKTNSRFTVGSAIPDDLPLLVTQNGLVFHWPRSEEDFEEILSASYIPGTSLCELVPSRSRKVSQEELQKEIDEADRRIERQLEETRRAQAERMKKTEDGASTHSSGAFDLPGLDDIP